MALKGAGLLYEAPDGHLVGGELQQRTLPHHIQRAVGSGELQHPGPAVEAAQGHVHAIAHILVPVLVQGVERNAVKLVHGFMGHGDAAFLHHLV